MKEKILSQTHPIPKLYTKSVIEIQANTRSDELIAWDWYSWMLLPLQSFNLEMGADKWFYSSVQGGRRIQKFHSTNVVTNIHSN